MTGRGRFTIARLFRRKSAETPMTAAAGQEEPQPLGEGGQAAKGLGLEIGNIAELPEAEDFAAQEFYRANFTPSEIAYSTKQPAVKAAFRGLLAAKRAIVRSGAAPEPASGLASIEIGFDGEGRPTYPGCALSICYTGTIAAAVCLWLGGIAFPGAPAHQALMTFKPGTRILAFLLLLSLLVAFAYVLWGILLLLAHR